MNALVRSQIYVSMKLAPGAMKPIFATHGAAGADLHAFIPERQVTLVRGARLLIRTGVCLELPPGYEGQIRSRSGLAVNHGIHVFNAPGTIDEDYRGEIKVLLRNSSGKDYVITNSDRIAQLIVSPVCRPIFQLSETFTETERGSAGFGSSGV